MSDVRTLVLLGHPRPESLCGSIAQAYARAARYSGAESRVLNLSELSFDPLLRAGFEEPQPLEPDLLRAREQIEWATHVTWVYPVWWGAPPALLKGFIDRAFLPGWAFNARPKGRPEGLLAGRSARLLVTMDAPGWFDRWFYSASARRSMQRATLWYTGFSPIRTRIFPEVLHSSAETRARWMDRVAADAASDVRHQAGVGSHGTALGASPN
ncbi:MAG: NAD(P)H-dependent oxidoreductase [Nannocystales bacterium]